MAEPANLLHFPTTRKRGFERNAGPLPDGIISLGEVRRQRKFAAAPNRLHDFEIDMLTVLIGLLTPEQRGEVIGCLDVFARWPPNRAYAEAAQALRARFGGA